MNQTSQDLVQLYKTLAFDLPMTSLRWAFGATSDKESTTAVWKGYDAGVRLATSTIDSLYRSQSLSEIVGNTVNQMLRMQQLTNAANSFVVTSFLRPFTVPATPELRQLTAPVAPSTNGTQPGRTPPTAPRRSRKRTVRVHEAAPSPAYSLPQQDELQAAA